MRWMVTGGMALLALGGCGSDGAAGNAGGGNAAAGSDTTSGATSEVRADAALSGLPSGIPPYPRPNQAGAIQFGGNSDGADVRVMGFQTADSPTEVIAFYSSEGERAGFREVQRRSTATGIVVGFERVNGEVMNVTATGAGGVTHVQIMAGRNTDR